MLKKLRRAIKTENYAQVTARVLDDEWVAATAALDKVVWSGMVDRKIPGQYGPTWHFADEVNKAAADAADAAEIEAGLARKKVRKILQKMLARYS